MEDLTKVELNKRPKGPKRNEEYEYAMAVFELSGFVLKYGLSKVVSDLEHATSNLKMHIDLSYD